MARLAVARMSGAAHAAGLQWWQ